mmetsp:Transcript_3372/g.6460  ORF Transcript_3372/g.6460 Transcript_3372/m.6460 type:complete len:172 (-) Transcript_3372:142-657(-)
MMRVMDGKKEKIAQKKYLAQERLSVGKKLLEMNASTLSTAAQYYAPNIEYRDPIVVINGITDMTEFLLRFLGSDSTFATVVENEIVSGDTYTATWVMEGTFGEFSYEGVAGMSIIKFNPGSTEAYYQRDYYTEGDLMVGIPPLSPAINGFRTIYLCTVDPNAPPETCPPPP